MTDGLSDAVALPPHGDGSRSARRGRASQRRPPRRPKARLPRSRPKLWLLPALLLAVGLAGGFLLLSGEDEPDAPAAPALDEPDEVDRETALVLGRDDAGALVSITLLVDAGRGGDLVHIPPGTMVEAASLGLVPFREAAVQGDDVVAAALENLLGARIPDVVALGPAELDRALEPGPPVQVELPERVQREVNGRIETVFPAGRLRVEPGRAMELLATPAATDLDRLVRHQAFWTGWLAAVAAAPTTAPAGTVLGPTAEHISRLAAGDVRHHILPVTAVAAADELYRVDAQGMARLLREVLPAAPASADRVAVQVLNGTGGPGVAQALVRPLIDAGARVALTGNADHFEHLATQVVYYRDEGEADARRIRDALGVGKIVRSRARIDAVDLTIVVGGDFPARVAGSAATTEGAPS